MSSLKAKFTIKASHRKLMKATVYLRKQQQKEKLGITFVFFNKSKFLGCMANRKEFTAVRLLSTWFKYPSLKKGAFSKRGLYLVTHIILCIFFSFFI